MNKIVSYIALFVITLTLSSILVGQDPIFSQFYASPLQLNPGLAGVSDEPNFALNYRNQWPGFPNAYQTYAISYDQFFEDYNAGLGLMITSDNAGDGILKTNKLVGVFAYRLTIQQDLYLKFGIEAGVISSRLNWDKLVFADQIDAELGEISPGGTPFPSTEIRPESDSELAVDAGIGALVYTPTFYVGFTMKHINNPNLNFLNINENLFGGLPTRLSVHAGVDIDIFGGSRTRTFLSPAAMLLKQGSFSQLNAGMHFNYGSISVGGWYRHTFENADAFIGTVGFRSGIVKINYSFDMTVSRIPLSGGTHEISIGINFDDGQSESIYNDCFSIFR